MTEQQQISRTQAWLESLRPKTLPLAFAAIIVGTALAWWQGYFDPLVALLALITAGLLQILSQTSAKRFMATLSKAAINRIASGRVRGMQKGVITRTGDEAGVNHYRRADLYLRTGAGGGRVPYVNRFCRLPDFGRAVDLSPPSPTPWVIGPTAISGWVISLSWYSLAG